MINTSLGGDDNHRPRMGRKHDLFYEFKKLIDQSGVFPAFFAASAMIFILDHY
jgi:hypothetical protein